MRKNRLFAVMMIAIALSICGTTPGALAQTNVRPISDFVDAQGTFCFPDGFGGCAVFLPPVPNFIGWFDAKNGINISVDYAGLANGTFEELSGGAVSLGTATTGTVIESVLADGRAEVLVLLRTTNALMFAVRGADFAGDPLLFGARFPDVLAGATPALGEAFLQVKFVNPAPGAPLPDLLQLFVAPLPGQTGPSFLAFRAAGKGELRAAFGVADGTPGRVEVVQTGLFMTGGGGATADAFPAERIILRAVGR